MAFLKRSPWIMHYDGSSCNGCDIEVVACLTPLYDVERFGVVNTGNPKHADILLITGAVNEANRQVVLNLYEQMPDPKVVVAVGICAASGGIFADCYNVLGGVNKVIPVDVLVPGCAARPEAIIDGVVLALAALEEKHAKLQQFASGKEQFTIETAAVHDAAEILSLQKMAYQSEAELYNDFFLSPLKQNLWEMEEDIRRMTVLKAVMGGMIIGSVRGHAIDDECAVGRLIVHPMYQNLGLGKKLLQAIEARFPRAERFELFTGHRSRRRIYFLQSLGYKAFRTERVSSKRDRLYMEKFVKRENND